MVFEFSKYVVDIDVDKTKGFYCKAPLVSDGCSCAGCRNYEKAIDHLSLEVVSFFDQFGIEMKKVCEVYVNCANVDNSILYGGFYHLCGKIISGESAWIPTSPNTKHLDEDEMFSIAKDFKVSFQEECALLADDFPTPAIQLEVLGNIPWVLEERNIFADDYINE